MKDPFWGIKAEGTLKFLHVSCYFTSPAGFKVTQNPIEGCDQRFRRRLCIFQSNPCAFGKDLKLAKPLRDFMEWKAAWCCIWLLNAIDQYFEYTTLTGMNIQHHPAILDFDVKTKEAPGYWSIPVRLGHVSGHGRLRLGVHFFCSPGQTWFGNARLNLISTSKGSRERSLRNCHRECRKKLIMECGKGGYWEILHSCKQDVSPSIYQYVWPPGRPDFTPHLEHIMLRNFPTNPAHISSMMGNSGAISCKKDRLTQFSPIDSFSINLMATVAALLLSQTEAGSTTRLWGSICQDMSRPKLWNMSQCLFTVLMPFGKVHKSPLAKWRDVTLASELGFIVVD